MVRSLPLCHEHSTFLLLNPTINFSYLHVSLKINSMLIIENISYNRTIIENKFYIILYSVFQERTFFFLRTVKNSDNKRTLLS